MSGLTQEQKNLCCHLYQAVRSNENIYEIIKEISNDDFLYVLIAYHESSKETILGTFEKLNLGHLKDVLSVALEKGILDQVINAGILSSKDKGEVKYISLVEYITDLKREFPSDALYAIQGSCGLRAFLSSINKGNRNKISYAVLRERDSNYREKQQQLGPLLQEIHQINNEITAKSDLDEENEAESQEEIRQFEKSMAIAKAMKVGSISSVIAALAVGGGCFAAGAALPILAIIGIAVAAAVLTGLIAGGITYAISKPSNQLEKASTQEEGTELKSMENCCSSH